jgi:16S rRNA (guanine966-N2)-methyltransferase
MRVISGSARGRTLKAAVPKDVRPTSDRVKEAMFAMVFSRGGVSGWNVVDLFCGTGGLGIEALSRGAEFVTFVDGSVRSIKAVEENLLAVGLPLSATARYRASLPGWKPAQRVDLVLADPPYDFKNWVALLEGFPADMAVCESATALPEIPGWETTKVNTYGTTLLSVLERRLEVASS